MTKCTHVKIILKNLTQKKNYAYTFWLLITLTQCSFGATKNKLDCYGGKYCMERFSKDLKEHATKIIYYEKKEIIPLTDEEN